MSEAAATPTAAPATAPATPAVEAVSTPSTPGAQSSAPAATAPASTTPDAAKVETKPEPSKEETSLRALAKKEQKAREAIRDAESKQKQLQDKEQSLTSREQALKNAADSFVADPAAFIKQTFQTNLSSDEMIDIACCLYAASGSSSVPEALKERAQQYLQGRKLTSLERNQQAWQEQQKQEQAAATQRQQLELYQRSLVDQAAISLRAEKVPYLKATCEAVAKENNGDDSLVSQDLANFASWLADQGDNQVVNPDYVVTKYEAFLKEQFHSQHSRYSHLLAPKTEEAVSATSAQPATTPSATPANQGAVKPEPSSKPDTLTNNNTALRPARGSADVDHDTWLADATRQLKELNSRSNRSE